MDELCKVIAIVVGIVVIFTVGLTSMGASIDSGSCQQFGVNSNRETRFVRYNYFSWDCLTPSKDGKWISAYNLRDITD